MQKNQRGFTLVELSIVLVIIGLLVGGVLTGQSLIRAAELRSVTAQEQRYIAAVQTFRDKYFALPGDMTNATAYWGTATNCPGTSAQPSTTAATCNGDGNGQINYNSTNSNESYRFWQHLANAGLIEGNYSGVDAGSNGYTTTTANGPSGRISSTLWYVRNMGTLTSTAWYFDGQYDNTLHLGALYPSGWPANPFIKPEDAYNIDTKMDDGMPATGKVVSISNAYGSLTGCHNAANSTVMTATYLLSYTGTSCAIAFRQAF